jgi:hypothetical protein
MNKDQSNLLSRIINRLVACIAILPISLFLSSTVRAQSVSMVWIDPSCQTIEIGETIFAQVKISSVEKVNAFDIVLEYDSDVISIQNYSPGDYLSNLFLLKKDIQPGLIQLVYVQLATPAVIGDGILLNFEIVGVDEGDTEVIVKKIETANTNGNLNHPISEDSTLVVEPTIYSSPTATETIVTRTPTPTKTVFTSTPTATKTAILPSSTSTYTSIPASPTTTYTVTPFTPTATNFIGTPTPTKINSSLSETPTANHQATLIGTPTPSSVPQGTSISTPTPTTTLGENQATPMIESASTQPTNQETQLLPGSEKGQATQAALLPIKLDVTITRPVPLKTQLAAQTVSGSQKSSSNQRWAAMGDFLIEISLWLVLFISLFGSLLVLVILKIYSKTKKNGVTNQ